MELPKSGAPSDRFLGNDLKWLVMHPGVIKVRERTADGGILRIGRIGPVGRTQNGIVKIKKIRRLRVL